MARKNEKGVALILTMILILVLSVMAVSMLFISQSETWSGMNYRMMTQARYGAEAGVHKAANFLQSANYTAPTAAQITANFTTTASPIVYSNAPATLSANSSLGSNNYPISDTAGFAALAGTPGCGTRRSATSHMRSCWRFRVLLAIRRQPLQSWKSGK
jgi:Tfp pilus assembly protein PilX